MVKVEQKTVIKKKKGSQQPVGFGARYPRFLNPYFHPHLDPSGLFLKKDAGCDPGLYDPIPISKVFQVNKNAAIQDVWRREYEAEMWSKKLGYRNQAILAERRFRASCGGPAYIDVKELNTDFSRRKNTGFGTTPRSKTVKFVTPAPGTYNKPLIPLSAPHVPPSNKQPFYFRKPPGLKVSSRGLAPNRYKIIDVGSMEMKSKKLVSLRGPYDLFTGPRDDTNIKNHFGSNKRDYCPSWPMALPDCFERLKKSRFGDISKQIGRDTPDRGRLSVANLVSANRCPNEPGPADTKLNPSETVVFKQNKAPFLSFEVRSMRKRTGICPNVGQYNLETRERSIAGNGHRHVFLCKVERGIVVPQPMNSF